MLVKCYRRLKVTASKPHTQFTGNITLALVWYIRVFPYYTKLVLLILSQPGNEVCEGYVFTSVCLSTGGQSTWAGTPAQDQVQLPRTRYTPQDQVHPLWARYPPGPGPPGPGTTPRTRYNPPGPGTPPSREHCIMGNTSNKRAVRILVEWIFVVYIIKIWKWVIEKSVNWIQIQSTVTNINLHCSWFGSLLFPMYFHYWH